MLKKIVSFITAMVMILTTFLSGMGTLPAKAASLSENEHMIVTSPWAYNLGSIDNSQTYADGGYEYATLVPGGEIYYHPVTMKDMDMSVYSEFRFAVKTNGTYYYEAGLAANDDFGAIVGAETIWTEYTFKYEDDGAGNTGYRLYKNGDFQSTLFPADLNLSDIQMKFSADTSSILYMTEVRGTLKENAEPSLKVIADTYFDANDRYIMTSSIEEPNFAATKSDKMEGYWTGNQDTQLASVDLTNYDKVIFYIRKYQNHDQSGWFESPTIGASFAVDYNWTEFKLIKNADNTWNCYIGGKLTKESVSLSNLSDIKVSFGYNYYCISQVFGETDKDEKIDFVNEHMIVTSPWAYNLGNIDNSQTYADGGYEYATLVPGGEIYYHPVTMKDMDMSVYSEFRFAVKTNGTYYYEAGLAANNDFGAIVGAETTWIEYTFKYEDDGAGNAGYRLYKNGNFQSTLFPADLNLSDIQMKFSADTNGILYMTEVRGTLKTDAEPSLKVIADTYFDADDRYITSSSIEEPNFAATKSDKMEGYWNGNQDTPLASVDLTNYDKVIFYIRKYQNHDQSGWFESPMIGASFAVDYNWTEFKLTRNADNTWNCYIGGKLTKESVSLSNLSDIKVSFGYNYYCISQVFGVMGEKQEEVKKVIALMKLLKAKAAYQLDNNNFDEKYDMFADGVIDSLDVEKQYCDMLGISFDTMIVVSPWACQSGSIDNSQTYAGGGYEYATLIPGGQVYYDNALMKDVDLSNYALFSFAVKTNGNYWYEGCMAEDDYNEDTLWVGCEQEWTEYLFKLEVDGSGNERFHMYKAGAATNVWLDKNMNLSDMKMRYSSDTNAILYMTELRGVKIDKNKESLKVIASCFNSESGTLANTERPNSSANGSTEVVTSWKSTQSPLASVDLSSYDKVIFYARKAGRDDLTGWFESAQLGSFQMDYAWTEFKLVRNADNTWNIYTGGMLKQSNVTLTNLSEITATYGDNHYYFSEVFGA